MICPYCSGDSKVTNSRHQKRSNSVWRRRQCLDCGSIWTTTERLESSGTYKVKSNESLVDFRSELLLISLYEALKHRKTPESDAKYVYETVFSNLQAKKSAIISTIEIAKSSYNVLKNYDKLAAELYKATHRLTD